MRMGLRVRFSRPINKKDFLSFGSYTVLLSDGSEKQFDFEQSESGPDSSDNTIYEVLARGIDQEYEDGKDITVELLRKIQEISEIFIGYSDEAYENEKPKVPMVKEVLDMAFSEYDQNGEYQEYEVPEEILNKAFVYLDPCV